MAVRGLSGTGIGSALLYIASRHYHVHFGSPKVLATTSIGQKGLDFHHYCHAIVHWDLPSNPVDLEQREGRIHRYKGHAIRKNLAIMFGQRAIFDSARDHASAGQADPWEALFERGIESRNEDQDDMVPFRVFATDGGASIERHVPAIPLSRGAARLAGLELATGRKIQEGRRVKHLCSTPSCVNVRHLEK